MDGVLLAAAFGFFLGGVAALLLLLESLDDPK